MNVLQQAKWRSADFAEVLLCTYNGEAGSEFWVITKGATSLHFDTQFCPQAELDWRWSYRTNLLREPAFPPVHRDEVVPRRRLTAAQIARTIMAPTVAPIRPAP